jgi:hypothetical protein
MSFAARKSQTMPPPPRKAPSTASLAETAGRSSTRSMEDLTDSARCLDAQELMRDNLEIMREIVMRIRTDEESAGGRGGRSRQAAEGWLSGHT